MALIKCDDCGNQVSERAQACPKCGAPVAGAAPAKPVSETKDKTAAYLIWFFLGTFGAHKFYLNRRNAPSHMLIGIVSILLVIAFPASFGGIRPRDCGTLGYRPDCQPGFVEDPASFPPTFLIGLIGISIAVIWAFVDLVKIPEWLKEANNPGSSGRSKV